jgi:Tol biopolymer transport system component
LERQPDFSALPPNLHPKIVEMLERCLEKEARNRYSSISDARVDIQKALADPNGVLAHPVTSVEPRTRLRAILPWAVAALVLGLIIAGVAVWKLKPSEPRRVMRFTYELPEGQQFSNLDRTVLAVSPDGKQFVYSTRGGLYLRSVDELTAKLIPGTEGDTQQPFFSPDGKWIGYHSVADRKLKKIAINGGAPVALCDVASLIGGSWGADDTIVYGQWGRGIMRISANGGTPESFIKANSGFLLFPQILPGGKSVLCTAGLATGQFSIMVQSLKSGEPKELFAGIAAQYLPTGHIVYAVGNNLLAVPFDPDRLEAAGPVSIVEGVYRTTAPQYALSDSGTLAYIPGTTGAAAPGRTLVWVDRNGKEEPLAAPPNAYAYPKISPDGTRVAVTITGDILSIWVWDLVRKILTRLTFDEGSDFQSIWTPDGKRIVYAYYRTGENGVCWKAADGTGVVEKLGSVPGRVLMPWSFSSDGKTLAMTEMVGGLYDIGVLSMEGDRARKLLLHQEKYAEVGPQISPDGRWIAYQSNESGRYEVYVRPFPEVDKGKWQVSTSGGSNPLWSPDGRELFFLSGGNSAMAIAVETKPVFNPGTPRTLFHTNFVSGTGMQWDISPDGKRFLMMKSPASGEVPTAAAPRPKINIVVNWFEELKQRVPVK